MSASIAAGARPVRRRGRSVLPAGGVGPAPAGGRSRRRDARRDRRSATRRSPARRRASPSAWPSPVRPRDVARLGLRRRRGGPGSCGGFSRRIVSGARPRADPRAGTPRSAGSAAPRRTAIRAARRCRSGARTTGTRDWASAGRRSDLRAGRRARPRPSRAGTRSPRACRRGSARRRDRSKWPWPHRLNRMTRASPASLAASASSIATRDGVGRLGCRQDALGAGELDAGLEARALVDAPGLDEAVLLEQADQRRHAVVAQAAGVDRLRDEVVAERVHLDERRHLGRCRRSRRRRRRGSGSAPPRARRR